jgi:hypothetical protein
VPCAHDERGLHISDMTEDACACVYTDNTWQVEFDSGCGAEAKFLGRTWKLLQ